MFSALTILSFSGGVASAVHAGMNAGVGVNSNVSHVIETSESCSTPYGSGTCLDTSECVGTCSGPNEVQCCIDGSISTDTMGLDVCDSMTGSTTDCFAESFSFIVPRGFRSTGEVDSSVCTTIKNAYSSGFKVRDSYMFPCAQNLLKLKYTKWLIT